MIILREDTTVNGHKVWTVWTGKNFNVFVDSTLQAETTSTAAAVGIHKATIALAEMGMYKYQIPHANG